MKAIKLSRNKEAVVDDEDYEWLNQFPWYTSVQRNDFYAETTSKVVPGQKGRNISMHLAIAIKHNIVEPGKEIDHRDGNPLNNRRENLRAATHAENMRNSRKRSDGITSLYKGVCKSKGQWLVQIRKEDTKHFLGYFNNEVEAAKVYDCYASKMFGEFARLNFPNDTILTEEECARLRIRDSKQQQVKGRVKYRGVSKRPKGFQCLLCYDGEQIQIGTFPTAYEAAKAYDCYSFWKRQDKQKLNFPEEKVWTLEDIEQHKTKLRKDDLTYRGVVRGGNKYHAKITHQKHFHWLGVFDTPEEAALAYNEAAIRLKGDKAKLNVIPTLLPSRLQ